MKKIIVLISVFSFSFAALAQDFRTFRAGFGGGFASPPGTGSKGGGLIYFEPSVRVASAFAIGLRTEVAVVERGHNISTVGHDVFTNNLHGLSSLSVNAQYYFSNGSFRPFVGAGAGVYFLAAASQTYEYYTNQNSTYSYSSVSGGHKVGFYPRAGFDLNHFVFTVEYNIVPGSSTTMNTTTTVTSGNSSTVTNSDTIKNGYLAIKIGFFLGGGRI